MFTTMNSIYSPESIAFQKDIFHKSLTEIIEKYRTDAKATNRQEFELAIAKCIKDYTNINFEIDIGDMPMMTEPPKIDKNSPMLEGYGWHDTTLSKQSIADIRRSKDKEVRALIDPSSGWVDGYFANLPPTRMHLNAPMIYGNKGLLYKLFDGRVYTSGELSAIILHEIGHIWTFFYFLTYWRTTNQILSALARSLEWSQDNQRREMIIKEAGSALDLDDIDAKELSYKSNSTVYTVIITNVARKNRSQSGVTGYDINSFEALSDQYATRQGAGRDLVTGLDKLMKGSIYKRGWVGYLYCEFAKLAILGLGVFEIATGQVPAAYTTFIILATLILADSHNDWYDKPGARFKRIRNDLVNQLKDETAPKEDSARIRADIDFIDKVNETMHDHTQIVGLVYDYLIPSGVNKRKQIQFQQALEEQASNKLFYYANLIKHA